MWNEDSFENDSFMEKSRVLLSTHKNNNSEIVFLTAIDVLCAMVI